MKINVNLVIVFSLLMTGFKSRGQVMLKFTDQQATVSIIKGGDEFESAEFNREKWMTAYPWARHLYCSLDVSVYSDGEDLIQKDGQLHITARKAPITTRAIPYEADEFMLTCDHKPSVKNIMHFNYQSGMIYSKQQFTFGYYEMNFKADKGEGFWPAFWLFGEENQEIDIFEIGGTKTNSYHVDVHCKNGCDNYKRFLGIFKSNWGDYIETNSDWSSSFHTAAIDWTPEGITWFIDGTPIAWWKGQFKSPMSVIANLAVTDKEGTFGGKVSSRTKFPSEMTLNFIRVWQTENKKIQLHQTNNDHHLSLLKQQQQVQMVRKKRPEFKKKVFKNIPDRIFAVLTKSNQLELMVETVKSSNFTVTIKNQSGKSVITTSLKSGFNRINLTQLNPGSYDVVVNNAGVEGAFSLEMQ